MIAKSVCFFLPLALAAQAPKPAPAPVAKPPIARAAAAVAPSMVDTVITLVKNTMSEGLILKTIQAGGQAINLAPADVLKLTQAGVSEKIITALMDPKSAVAAAAPAPAAPVAPVVNAIAPAAAAPPTGQATPFPPPLANAPVANNKKRRLAVTPFDYSAVKTWVTYWFQNDVNIGQGIRAMLTARMHQSKNIILLERAKTDDLMKEQDFGATNRVAQGSKAKIGKITGADAILFGDIVIFGRDDKTKRKGIGAAIGGTLGGAMTFNKEEKAVVGINLRIVDAETGEVIETAEARGESSRKSKNWGGLLGTSGGGAAVGSDMTSTNFEETIIGEATSDAVNKTIAWLDQKIPMLAGKNRNIDGRVANFTGTQMYISVGANDGVLLGDRFEIHQINNEVIDPETKQVLDKETVKVGEFVVHQVREKIAIGQYGGQPISMQYPKGYAARLVLPPPPAEQK
ncbi:MAG: CsgG/HfaB family protein [Bryobacteraceae bacterium]